MKMLILRPKNLMLLALGTGVLCTALFFSTTIAVTSPTATTSKTPITSHYKPSVPADNASNERRKDATVSQPVLQNSSGKKESVGSNTASVPSSNVTITNANSDTASTTTHP